MDFLLRQEAARRHTRWLVVLFILGVIGTVGTLDLLFVAIWMWPAKAAALNEGLDWSARAPSLATQLWPIGISLAVILGATAYKLIQLSRRGGRAVAELAGGRRLRLGEAAGFPEQQLQNVVDEMAIASGVPRPEVWLIDGDPGINAFAAGYRPEEAVLGVTRGALSLPRGELQGIVAHEFSHILSGDMRLNMRLLTAVFGILSIATIGRRIRAAAAGLPRAGLPDDDEGSIRKSLFFLAIFPWLFGVIVLLIGSVGVLFAKVIRAAISRQREFSSDAAAVEFTRSPDGIGQALVRVAATADAPAPLIRESEAMSHFFFVAPGKGRRRSWLGSHPPIRERLRRIYGRPV
jgi:Zn-dependent protease with chaperone function